MLFGTPSLLSFQFFVIAFYTCNNMSGKITLQFCTLSYSHLRKYRLDCTFLASNIYHLVVISSYQTKDLLCELNPGEKFGDDVLR